MIDAIPPKLTPTDTSEEVSCDPTERGTQNSLPENKKEETDPQRDWYKETLQYLKSTME